MLAYAWNLLVGNLNNLLIELRSWNFNFMQRKVISECLEQQSKCFWVAAKKEEKLSVRRWIEFFFGCSGGCLVVLGQTVDLRGRQWLSLRVLWVKIGENCFVGAKKWNCYKKKIKMDTRTKQLSRIRTWEGQSYLLSQNFSIPHPTRKPLGVNRPNPCVIQPPP